MSEQKFVRKQYLVDRVYQIRFVTRVFAAVLAVAVISSLIATGLLWSTMYQPAETGMQVHLTVALIAIAVTLLIELLLAIPVVFFLGIRQSHRIVGPMNRIKKMLESYGNGDFSQRMVLREGDALEDLAKALNAMADRLQQRSSR